MAQIGIGLIGAGPHGLTFRDVAAYRNLGEPHGRIVAVAETVSERREEARILFPEAKIYEDHVSLLVDPAVRGVIVATPATVRQPVLDAIHGGKHVLFEKPLATSLAEADQIIAEARKDPRLICAGNYQWGLTKGVEFMRAALEEGLAGKPLMIRVEGKGRPAAVEIMEIGQHVMGVAMQFTGPIVSCTASVLKNGHPITPADVEMDVTHRYFQTVRHVGVGAGDVILATYETQSGIPILAEYLPTGQGVQKCSVRIIGTEGRLEARGGLLESFFTSRFNQETIANRCTRMGGWSAIDTGLPSIVDGQEADAMIDPRRNTSFELFHQWLKAINGEAENPFSLDRARQVLEAVLLPYASAAAGGRVVTPLSGEHPLLAWQRSVDS